MIPVMLLTTKYISYASAKKKYDTFRLKLMADLENYNLGLNKCKPDIEMFVNLMTNNDAPINKL